MVWSENGEHSLKESVLERRRTKLRFGNVFLEEADRSESPHPHPHHHYHHRSSCCPYITVTIMEIHSDLWFFGSMQIDCGLDLAVAHLAISVSISGVVDQMISRPRLSTLYPQRSFMVMKHVAFLPRILCTWNHNNLDMFTLRIQS